MALTARSQDRKHNRRFALPANPTHPPGEAEMPIDKLAETGVGTDTAYELIKSELLLDGQARLKPGDVREHVDAGPSGPS